MTPPPKSTVQRTWPAALPQSILANAGAAFSNDVRATPTYMVNGRMIDPGNEGKALESYVAGLVKW